MPVFFSPLGLTNSDGHAISHRTPSPMKPGLYPCAHTTTYKHMRTLAGPDASIAFTHLSRSASASLSTALNPPAPSSSSSSSPDPASPAPAHAECHEQGVLSLMQARNIPLEHVCLLDPKAPTALTPADGDGDAASKFAWFLFGVRILRSLFLPKPCRPLTTPLYSFGRVGFL